MYALEQAFQVKLLQYSHARGDYRGRVGSVQIPAALKGIVVGVFGLDDRPVVRKRKPHSARSASVRAALGQSPAHATVKKRAWFFPSELATIYHFPPGDGTGQTIGLLEFGGGYFPADLATFCKDANVAVPTVIPISVDGTATDAVDGAEGEVMLDIEVLAGACPKATIVAYFSNFDEQGWGRRHLEGGPRPGQRADGAVDQLGPGRGRRVVVAGRPGHDQRVPAGGRPGRDHRLRGLRRRRFGGPGDRRPRARRLPLVEPLRAGRRRDHPSHPQQPARRGRLEGRATASGPTAAAAPAAG